MAAFVANIDKPTFRYSFLVLYKTNNANILQNQYHGLLHSFSQKVSDP